MKRIHSRGYFARTSGVEALKQEKPKTTKSEETPAGERVGTPGSTEVQRMSPWERGAFEKVRGHRKSKDTNFRGLGGPLV